MSRYIDADILKNKTTRVNHIWNGTTNAEGKGLDEIIDDIPTADVVEVEKLNKIYEELEDMFDIPCNFSPCDEIMSESERCRKDCGNISGAECWKRYFEVVCDGERAEE